MIDAIKYFNPVARIHREDSDRDVDFSARTYGLFRGRRVGRPVP